MYITTTIILDTNCKNSFYQSNNALPFHLVALNISSGILELTCCQIRNEAFFLKYTKKGSKTKKLRWMEY